MYHFTMITAGLFHKYMAGLTLGIYHIIHYYIQVLQERSIGQTGMWKKIHQPFLTKITNKSIQAIQLIRETIFQNQKPRPY